MSSNGDNRLAVDVGGTFTDAMVLRSDQSLEFGKVPTTPSDPTLGVMEAFRDVGVTSADVALFVHGTTLGLNALLTRSGARTAIVTTRGFRDVYLLGRTDRTPMYDLKYRKPASLVRRADCFEVEERVSFTGEVLTPFHEDGARTLAQKLSGEGYESVAVTFLHSYSNPEHERRMGEILSEVAPHMEVTLSHELSREYREYERTSTAVLDAYIKPVVRRYLKRLDEELMTQGFDGRFLVTRSGGGAMTARTARDAPANLILSGPAGGVIGAEVFAELTDERNLITIDMGGTSLDAALIVNGVASRQTVTSFEGLPILFPSLNINTIGAGGGSIIWIDEANHMRIGPASAGADPGPAAYLKGGDRPTVTDAALVVGYLGSETALGGTLLLDLEAARHALEPLAQQLGMSIEATARGALEITTTRIVGAVREITVEIGHNPKDFALMAFGGGGGMLGVDVARELNISKLIVPPGPGAFCALGMLLADVQHDLAQTRVIGLADTQPDALENIFVGLISEGADRLRDEGFDSDHIKFERFLDMRYQGQEHSVVLPIAGEPITEETMDAITLSFVAEHSRLYGHVLADPVQLVTLRVRAIGVMDRPPFPLVAESESPPESAGARLVHVDRGPVEYALYQRTDLGRGDVVEGPAVVLETTSTTVVHKGDRLVVGDRAELIIDIKEGDAS